MCSLSQVIYKIAKKAIITLLWQIENNRVKVCTLEEMLGDKSIHNMKCHCFDAG